jgi:hypothetical protein
MGENEEINMQVSRINQLRKAQEDTELYLKNSPENVEPYIDALIDLVVETFSTSPKPVSHPQYVAEMVEVQRCATYLFERLSHYLYVTDRVGDVYQCLQNPLVLSYGIAVALSKPDEDRYVAMGRKAVSLGGILTSSYARSGDIGDPQAYRASRSIPPLDIIKGALVNQFKNEWAIEHDATDNLRYGQFICVMWGHVADVEPEWAIRFMLEHEERLSELMNNCFHPYKDERKFLSALLRTTLTAKPFIELQRQCPAYFDELQVGSFLPEHIEYTLVKYPQFKLSEFPFIETIFELHLSSYFLQCVTRGTLSDDRLADLRKAWTKYDLKGDIAVEALKSVSIKQHLAFVKPYYTFIQDPLLTPQQILDNSKEFTKVNQHFGVLDELLNKPGKCLVDSPAALENHMAYVLSATPVDKAFCQKMLVTPKILEVCLLKLAANNRGENEVLIDFMTDVLKDKKQRQTVAKLSHDMVKLLQKVIPDLDIALVRAIKWEDPVIKAELLEDALGL